MNIKTQNSPKFSHSLLPVLCQYQYHALDALDDLYVELCPTCTTPTGCRPGITCPTAATKTGLARPTEKIGLGEAVDRLSPTVRCVSLAYCGTGS